MRIGILTGGGDAAGLNPAIRAVVVAAERAGSTVIGLEDGWAGLLEGGRSRALQAHELDGWLRAGGTMLGSSRTNPLALEHGIDEVVTHARAHQLDALVAIGGDDTLSVAAALSEQGLPVVGVPKTVDFDLAVTEYCIGFDSAVAIVAEACDRLATTGASHHRTMVLEVMGRDTGWLAIMGALAGGADLAVLPEFPMDVSAIVDHAVARRASGHRSSLLLVAEGAVIEGLEVTPDQGATDAFGHVALARRSVGERLADALANATGLDTRATALGHVQRGGPPAAADRIWPTRLGVAAVESLLAGTFGVCLGVVSAQPCAIPLSEVVAFQKRVPAELYATFAAVR
jgi:6-phosphofructokinase 1